MHHKPFGGRTPPGPAGGLQRSAGPLAGLTGGPPGKGRGKGRDGVREEWGGEGRKKEKDGEGKGGRGKE